MPNNLPAMLALFVSPYGSIFCPPDALAPTEGRPQLGAAESEEVALVMPKICIEHF